MAEMRLLFPTFLYERHKIIFLPRFCLGWLLCLNIRQARRRATCARIRTIRSLNSDTSPATVRQGSSERCRCQVRLHGGLTRPDAGRHPPEPPGCHQLPRSDEQPAHQRNDHGLADGSAVVGRLLSVPLHQRALLVEHRKAPCQLDHAGEHTDIARLPFLGRAGLTSFLPAGRCSGTPTCISILIDPSLVG
jgi:hypothetical protein